MADKKISELNQLTELNVSATDVAAVADISASETRKVTVPDLAQSGIRLMPDGSINGSKIEDGTIGTNQLADGSVTDPKVVITGISRIADNAVTTSKLNDDAVTTQKIGADEVTLRNLNPSNYGRGLDKNADNVGITNSIVAGTYTGITYNEQGLITGVDPDGTGDVPRTDLPIATDSDVGVVSVPTDGGLTVSGTGAVRIDNTVTAGTNYKVSYDEHGLVTGSTGVDRADLPIAGTDQVGVVMVPDTNAAGGNTPLDIDSAGNIQHTQSGVTAGTYTRVGVDAYGHVTTGSTLTASDIPDLGADQITSGTLPTASATPEQGWDKEVYTTAIIDESISRRHFNDVSIAYIQETQPPQTSQVGTDLTVFRGCLWLKESSGQLYMHNGNSWNIVAGGQLSQENLRFMGTYDAATNKIVALTDEGASELDASGQLAFTAGQPVPNCDDDLSGCYFLVETAGSNININNVVGDTFAVGDFLLGLGATNGWVQVSGAFSPSGGGGTTLWSRTGSSPTAELTPINSADNLMLQGSDWLALPHGGTAGAPSSSQPGTIRWNQADSTLEIWNGTAWEVSATTSATVWETVLAADNPNWTQDVVRTIETTSDVAVHADRSVVFEQGANTSNLLLASGLTSPRTYTLPDESGTVLTDSSTIDCGTY